MAVKVIDYRDKQAPEQFAVGLKEIGFAVVTHHPLSLFLIDEAYAKWYEFFHSPERFNLLSINKLTMAIVLPPCQKPLKATIKKI